MSVQPGLDDLLACAVDAVRAAGGHALHNSHRLHEVMEAARHDVKLVLDRESQDQAEKAVLARFPKHRILGEEGTAGGSGGNGWEWVIDPIDGTVNFSRGFSWWCSSAAVRREGRVLAGAVYAPALDLLYTATAESPARLNDREISVSRRDQPADCVMLTGISKGQDDMEEGFARMTSIAPRIFKTRLMGAAALDLCQVAEGKAEVFYESGIHIWDIAAASLIVERAGGTAEIVDERPDGRLAVLADNGLVHRDMLAWVGGKS